MCGTHFAKVLKPVIHHVRKNGMRAPSYATPSLTSNSPIQFFTTYILYKSIIFACLRYFKKIAFCCIYIDGFWCARLVLVLRMIVSCVMKTYFWCKYFCKPNDQCDMNIGLMNVASSAILPWV